MTPPRLLLVLSIFATVFWTFNGYTAATTDTPPSSNELVYLLAMTALGASIGFTVNLVLALLRVGYYANDAPPPDPTPTGTILGVMALGMATATLLGESSTRGWLSIGLLSVAAGFALVPSPIRRLSRADDQRPLQSPTVE